MCECVVKVYSDGIVKISLFFHQRRSHAGYSDKSYEGQQQQL